MKGFFKSLRKDSVLLWSFWVSIVVVIAATITIAASFSNLPPVIPLYNHMPWGYARLGKTYELFLLPTVTLCIVFINAFIGVKLLTRVPLLARFLFLTMISLSFFMLIFLIRLIFISI